MKLKRIGFLVCVVALAFTLSSCEELLKMLLADSGITIEEQIDGFEVTLNGVDRTDLLTHFHPVEMVSYQQLADDEVFDIGPLSYANAAFEIGVPTVDAYDVATCDYLDANGATGTIVFTMALDGSDYKIKKFVLTINTVSYVIERFQSR